MKLSVSDARPDVGRDADGRYWRRASDGVWVQDDTAKPKPGRPRARTARRTAAEVEAAWRNAPAGDGIEPRDQLIERLVPNIEGVIWKFVRKLPAHVDIDSLRGAAYEALVRGVDSFQPGRSATVAMWVTQKAWFAMQDELRRQDFLSRADRKAGADVVCVSLDQTVRDSEYGELTMVDTIAGTADVEAQVILMDELRRLWGQLTERERVIVQGFAAGLSGAEIAEQLGVSESRVSQILTRAAATARARERGDTAPCRAGAMSRRRQRAAA